MKFKEKNKPAPLRTKPYKVKKKNSCLLAKGQRNIGCNAHTPSQQCDGFRKSTCARLSVCCGLEKGRENPALLGADKEEYGAALKKQMYSKVKRVQRTERLSRKGKVEGTGMIQSRRKL